MLALLIFGLSWAAGAVLAQETYPIGKTGWTVAIPAGYQRATSRTDDSDEKSFMTWYSPSIRNEKEEAEIEVVSKVDSGAGKEPLEFCGTRSSVVERDVVALKHAAIGANHSHICKRVNDDGTTNMRVVYVLRYSKTENGLELFTTLALIAGRKSVEWSKTKPVEELIKLVDSLNPPTQLAVSDAGKPDAAGSMQVVPEETSKEKPEAPPPPRKPKKFERRKSAVVGREASEWKPYPVKKISGGGAGSTSFFRLVRKIAVKVPPVEGAESPSEGEAPKEKFTISYKGTPSKARAVARTYKSSGQQLLIVSVYPQQLKSGRIHLELRFIVDEGFLQNAKIAGVRILGDVPSAEREKWDSRLLRRQGIEFEEWAPSGGRIEIAHLDPLSGARGFNAGKVFMAEFGDKELGAVNLTYSVSGVAAP